MQFIGKDKDDWARKQRLIKELQSAKKESKEYAQEIKQAKWNKWTERILRWFIIISIIMIYNLFIGAIAIHIYQ